MKKLFEQVISMILAGFILFANVKAFGSQDEKRVKECLKKIENIIYKNKEWNSITERDSCINIIGDIELVCSSIIPLIFTRELANSFARAFDENFESEVKLSDIKRNPQIIKLNIEFDVNNDDAYIEFLDVVLSIVGHGWMLVNKLNNLISNNLRKNEHSEVVNCCATIFELLTPEC